MNYGKQNENFFSGKTKKRSSKTSFLPVENWSDNRLINTFNLFNRGNFSSHIFKMIPTFYNMQLSIFMSIFKNRNYFNSILDLGAAEFGFLKALGYETEIKCTGIDANIDMIRAANNFEPFKNPIEQKNVKILHAAFLKGWDKIKTFRSYKKYDLITEFFLFQFMNNDRSEQLKGVKKLLSKKGVFITCEKFLNSDPAIFSSNELLKNEYQKQYFSADEITKDKQTIIAGMEKDMVSIEAYYVLLKENFNYVRSFWKAGNFCGLIASDNKTSFNNIVNSTDYIKF